MPDFVFNVAKGRVAELVTRVDANDPANSALVVMVLATTGLETDAVLKDADTFAAVVAGATNEVTNVNYARKVLTDVDLAAPTPDDVNDRFDVDIPDLVWSPGPAAGDGWSKLVVGYDSDTTAGTDANIVPLTAHDFVLVPDGSVVQATINVAGFFRAT